jgi:UTP:GlnB (protein PII) uridylyltransferase
LADNEGNLEAADSRTLESLSPALGLEGRISHLINAERMSNATIDFLRSEFAGDSQIAQAAGQNVADVVAFGSLARREFTASSDFDFLVVLSRVKKLAGFR